MEHPRRTPERILVIRMRYLGDVLLLQPALRALRRAFPSAEIDALVNAGTEVALHAPGCVNEIIPWPRGDLPRELRTVAHIRSRRYDWAIDLTGNDRSAMVSVLSGAALRAGYHRPKQPWFFWRNRAYNVRPHHRKQKPHIILQHLELLEACGVPPAGTDVHLEVPPENARWAKGFLGARSATGSPPLLHAHLASRDMRKSLPPDLVRRVLTTVLSRTPTTVTLSHGPAAEADHARACVAGLPPDRIRLAAGLTWGQLISLIDAADAYWGADTAPMHAAAALGKPLLVHFGPSNANHWRPLHDGADATVTPCPCLKSGHWSCPEGSSGRCFTALDSVAISDKLTCLLGNARLPLRTGSPR
ncbi:MAG TPA: glycosyltransferase family 9 protein [Verrucomicrobiae bacterium]|nr:glycosyltransferase family 9 protein [Verrucomicrobiae bacterium]